MEVGDGRKNLVWAKLRYCAFWPARRVKQTDEIPKEMRNQPRNTECVFFFASKNYGFVQTKNILDYESNRMKYVKKGRGQLFHEAVKQMDEFITDPITFASNGYLNPVNDGIILKSERGSVVKTERDIEEMPYETEKIQCHTTNTQIEYLKKEKEQIIKDLVTIKGENQKLTLQLQQKSREIDKLKAESSATISSLTRDVQRMSSEIEQFKQQLSCEKSKNQKQMTSINDLHREKSMLSAQISGLQSTAQLHQGDKDNKNNNSEDDDDDEECEVECILDHRIYKRYRKFLVRWKGFSSEEDLWLNEKDLHCPNILMSYLKKHDLNPPN